ncbi:hypothetical protein DF058_17765 [Burkholderia cenocepacia]|nr:hypothetical protein DF058_17765 [Burkholderia cenocepacia]RRA14463.1 hypothetical protein DF059_17915 [Burkholderia cenocepacia]
MSDVLNKLDASCECGAAGRIANALKSAHTLEAYWILPLRLDDVKLQDAKDLVEMGMVENFAEIFAIGIDAALHRENSEVAAPVVGQSVDGAVSSGEKAA